MLSQKDEIILDLLQRNSKYSSREISEKTGIPITTVHNRIKMMEREGVIKTYSVVVDKKKVGKPLSAYVLIKIAYTTPDGTKLSSEEIGSRISTMPEVEECALVTGTTDIIAKVSTKDIDTLHNFVIKKLREIDGIQSTVTSIVLKSVEKEHRI